MTNTQSKMLDEDDAIREKRREYYMANRERIGKYMSNYYFKNITKYKAYYKEYYRTQGILLYNENKKEILFKKKQKYHLEKNKKSVHSLEETNDKPVPPQTTIPIIKSACQVRTNNIVRNLELLKLKAEAFKKSLNDN